MLAAIQKIHSFEQTNKTGLIALQLRSHQITDSEVDEVNIMVFIVLGHYLFAGSKKMVNEKVCVVEHKRG